MKRILELIIAVTATLTLAACSSGDSSDTDSKADNTTNSTPTDDLSSAADPSNTESVGNDSSEAEPAASAYENAVAVLDAAWAAYPEADKFPVMGGSRDVAEKYSDKSGPFTITETAELASSLKVPESIMPQIKSAASAIHMMNANTFTSAVFEVDGDIGAFSSALVDGVNSTQWICGIPETVITFKIGNYLIMAFGNGEVVGKFKTAVTSAVDGAVLVHEGPISLGGGIAVGGDGNGGGINVPVF